MLHLRDYYLITFPDELAAIAVCYQVDALSRAAREDDLLWFGGIDETLDLDASAFILARRELAEIIHAAMDVRVLLCIVALESINHDLRFLRCRRAVEINKRQPVDFLVEDREVLTYAVDIEIRFHSYLFGEMLDAGC